MARIKKIYKENFTVVSSEMTRDKRMSFKERGLLLTLLSLPENWDFSAAGLAALVDGISIGTINSSLKKLEELGYLKREKIRDEKGRYIDCEYTFSDSPMFDVNLSNCPYIKNPHMDNPYMENCTQLNIQESNIQELNTNLEHQQLKEKQTDIEIDEEETNQITKHFFNEGYDKTITAILGKNGWGEDMLKYAIFLCVKNRSIDYKAYIKSILKDWSFSKIRNIEDLGVNPLGNKQEQDELLKSYKQALDLENEGKLDVFRSVDYSTTLQQLVKIMPYKDLKKMLIDGAKVNNINLKLDFFLN